MQILVLNETYPGKVSFRSKIYNFDTFFPVKKTLLRLTYKFRKLFECNTVCEIGDVYITYNCPSHTNSGETVVNLNQNYSTSLSKSTSQWRARL